KALGWSLEEELKRLLLHGFVHLLGFDHETSLQAEEKFRRLEGFLMEKTK
ncbi:MAG: rRNA maturation factor, partial [Aquificaceae bacterium]